MPLLLSESIQLLKSFYGKSGYPRESLQLMKSDVYRDVINQYQQDLSEGHIINKGDIIAKKAKL